MMKILTAERHTQPQYLTNRIVILATSKQYFGSKGFRKND